MSRVELFHRIADPGSAAARKRVMDRGVKDRVEFRNVDFDEHRAALAAHGGSATPALWDGAALHTGLDAVLEAIDRL